MQYFFITILVLSFPFLCVLMYWAVTDQMYKFWEIFRGPKRRKLQEYIGKLQGAMNAMNAIDDRIFDNKMSSFSISKIKNTIKNSWELSSIKSNGRIITSQTKSYYNEYMEFCKDKELYIPEIEAEYEEIIEKAEDLFYPETITDRALKKEQVVYNEAYDQVNKIGMKLHYLRERSTRTLEMTQTLISSMENIPGEFKDELDIINDGRDSFISKVEYVEKNYKKTVSPELIAGAGVAAGVAVAVAAPSVAMWVATTFGTASTGVAISSLSGAAATNAATAWLGGGAVAAGGGGMAAGRALLSLAGPIGVGVAGYFLYKAWQTKKIKEEIEELKKQDLCRLKNATTSLRSLSEDIEKMVKDTEFIQVSVNEQLYANNGLHRKDYDSLTRLQKSSLHALLSSSKKLAGMINQDIVQNYA